MTSGDFVVLAGAYLLGALPFSYWLVRATKGVDVRSVGSGNAGATNVMRVAGKGPAILALILDAAKGTAAVLLAERFGSVEAIAAWACLAAVLGHMYPWLLGFRGGKGVATAAGALGYLLPLIALLALAVFIVSTVLTRFVSLGSVLAAATFPLAYLALGLLGFSEFSTRVLIPIGIVGGLVILKHRANLVRLRAGTESRLGSRA